MKQTTIKRGRAEEWTRERVAQLPAQEILQLRENAARLNEPDLAAMCSDVLAQVRTRARAEARGDPGAGARVRNLVARTRAFEARGVFLQDARTSWGGVRKSDGAIVLALWADAVESIDGACRCLLWAENTAGSRPWSDTPAGRERLEHCKRAVELGRAEGLLVYGRRLEGRLPEERAAAIHGADAETVLNFKVEARGQEYWAVWGKTSRDLPASAQ